MRSREIAQNVIVLSEDNRVGCTLGQLPPRLEGVVRSSLPTSISTRDHPPFHSSRRTHWCRPLQFFTVPRTLISKSADGSDNAPAPVHVLEYPYTNCPNFRRKLLEIQYALFDTNPHTIALTENLLTLDILHTHPGIQHNHTRFWRETCRSYHLS